APPVTEVKRDKLERSDDASNLDRDSNSDHACHLDHASHSDHVIHSEHACHSDHSSTLEPSDLARDAGWEAPDISDHSQAVRSNGGALEKEEDEEDEDAQHGGGPADGKGEEVEEVDEAEVEEEEDEANPEKCRKDQWEEGQTEKQEQHGEEEAEADEVEEEAEAGEAEVDEAGADEVPADEAEMVEVQEDTPGVEEARQGGIEAGPERGEASEGSSLPPGEPTTEEAVERGEVGSADVPSREPLAKINTPEEATTKRTDIIRKILTRNEEEQQEQKQNQELKLNADQQMEEKTAHTFSEAIIYSLLQLRSGKMASSFDQLKQYDIKLNGTDLNKTVKKYHSRGDLFLYYMRYVQRQEREAQRLYENFQTANKEVQTVRRRFRLNYGSTPTETDLNQEVYTRDKQVRRAQILLENKLSSFEKLANVKEAYRIVDEVRLQLGQVLSGGEAEGDLRKGGTPLAIKNYLKNGITDRRENMNKISSRGKTNGELLNLHSKYDNFRSDVQALVKMMTLLYARFSDRKRPPNEEDTNDTLNEIKIFAYDRKVKKIIRNLNSPTKNGVPIQPWKGKEVAGGLSGGSQFRSGTNTRGRSRRRGASSSYLSSPYFFSTSPSPPMVFILDIKKKTWRNSCSTMTESRLSTSTPSCTSGRCITLTTYS
ncbi:hypothetical protein PCYB_132660, partial [Plasmodium cynomolgi strain B]